MSADEGDDGRSSVEAARRDKRAALEAQGIPAFAYRYERSHTAAEALAAYDDAMGEQGPAVAVAGRIVARRSQGKTTFAAPRGRLRTHPGVPAPRRGRRRVRAARAARSRRPRRRARAGVPDQGGGDHRSRGEPRRAGRRSEPGGGSRLARRRADAARQVAASAAPRQDPTGDGGPTTFGGLQDPELRYRQRYADLAVHPEVRAVFRSARAR